MGRWQRSRQLASSSWGVLKQDKELMVLPLISGIACLIIAATFLVPIFVSAQSTNSLGNDTTKLGPLQYLLFFLMYAVLAYVTVFFKTALLCGADERMRGGNPTVGTALAGAGKHAGAILPWAILSATVTIILRAVEERSGLLGRIVIGIVGVAWAAVTFLVLPVLVFENVGVGEAVKRSAQMLKKTWGENLIVNGGIGLIGFLLMLPAFALVAIGFAADAGTGLGIAVTVSVAVLWIVAVTCWSNAMTSVFQLALYRYAIEGHAPAAFAEADLGSAFSQRSHRNSSFGY